MKKMNSKLATYTVKDKDNYGLRPGKIDTISIHCFVAQVTAKRGANALIEKRGAASANYVVGYDGLIAVNVDEDKASMCTSNSANDLRAVTIEVASDNYAPYAVTDKAYKALIELVTDICIRNDIKKLVWSTNKNDRVNHLNGCNMTVHRDYSNKACPGEYLYSHMGDIANQVNAKLELKRKQEEAKMTYEQEYAKAKELGITDGSNPDSPATRKQVAVMIYRGIKIVLQLIGKISI